MRLRFFVAHAISGILAFLICSAAIAQQESPAEDVKQVQQKLDQLKKEVQELERTTAEKIAQAARQQNKKIEETSTIVRKYSEQFTDYQYVLKVFSWVIGVIAACLGLIFAWWQIHQLDRESQNDKMLRKGEQTISLVNDILNLTRVSTENAMKSAETRMQKEFETLSTAVNRLMTFSNRDTREVIAQRDKNDELKDLFSELTVLEFSNRNLERTIELPPACMFLKALKHSEEGRFDTAIRQWRETYSAPKADLGIKIRSRYWIGYEQNSLGRFQDAEGSFAAAMALASGESDERRLELQRLNIESKLFRSGGVGVERLISEINALIHDCESRNTGSVAAMALRTKGNILYTASLHASRQGDKKKAVEYMSEAKELWKSLIGGAANFIERWEYIFSCAALQQDLGEADKLLAEKVREEARRQYTNCIGHKSKAFYAAIQLMVAKAQNASERAEAMNTRANFHVGEMHELEWPFSPLRKRPVSREEFQDDIKWITDNGLPAIV
jgi:tetratricopeptide (TPR) repeat protein